MRHPIPPMRHPDHAWRPRSPSWRDTAAHDRRHLAVLPAIYARQARACLAVLAGPRVENADRLIAVDWLAEAVTYL